MDTLSSVVFDVVFMDLRMPIMDGTEATRRIRADAGWAELPIIAMTARVMKGDVQRCLDAGMNDYIAKPINLEKIRAMMEKWTAGRVSHELMPEQNNDMDPRTGGDTQDEPAVDLAQALDQLSGDRALFNEVAATFVDTIPDAIKELRKACAAADADMELSTMS